MPIGDGTGTDYPAAIDTAETEINGPSPSKTRIDANTPNDQNAAILAIETELGTDPAGTASDLKTRLAVLMTDAGNIKDIGDDVFRVVDNTDSTKKLAFEVSGVSTGTTRTITIPDISGTIKVVGKETIWVPAVAMTPATTNGCASLAQTELTAQRPEIRTLDFDGATAEYALFNIAFPKSWDLGTITAQAFWTGAVGTGTVAFKIAALSVSNDDPIDTAFGTEVLIETDTFIAANDLHVTAESGAITIGGTPIAGDDVYFQVRRDPSVDTKAEDAKLLGLKIFFTTNATNDA